jgi:hypothetical protein
MPIASPVRCRLPATVRVSVSRSAVRGASGWLSELREALPAYELGQTLGRGAYGLVHAARDVAIKQLWPDLLRDDDARIRFAIEARLTASLDHPNIVRVYDYVEGRCAAPRHQAAEPALDRARHGQARRLWPRDGDRSR